MILFRNQTQIKKMKAKAKAKTKKRVIARTKIKIRVKILLKFKIALSAIRKRQTHPLKREENVPLIHKNKRLLRQLKNRNNE